MVAISAPTKYRSEPLGELLRRRRPTFVSPDLLPYFPCAQLPALHNGIVEEPAYAVQTRFAFNTLDDRGSPFTGIETTFDLERLSTVDEGSDRGELILFRVRNPSDGTLLPAESKTTAS
jgi:hypothetical protein